MPVLEQDSESSSGIPKRSSTGHHDLLPASESHVNLSDIPLVPTRGFIGFTFGRGTVVRHVIFE